jgi:hypothetical protein
MIVEKVMEILSTFETQAINDIERDHEIKADPYESVGRHVLIRNIKRKIRQQLPILDDDKEAA